MKWRARRPLFTFKDENDECKEEEALLERILEKREGSSDQFPSFSAKSFLKRVCNMCSTLLVKGICQKSLPSDFWTFYFASKLKSSGAKPFIFRTELMIFLQDRNSILNALSGDGAQD